MRRREMGELGEHRPSSQQPAPVRREEGIAVLVRSIALVRQGDQRTGIDQQRLHQAGFLPCLRESPLTTRSLALAGRSSPETQPMKPASCASS
jgi:hypothetical protein